MATHTTHHHLTNQLAGETSPYLLQHAHNPVAWYPWHRQALDEARNENKPILLSIGYSACHWCHVMAHESFEDETTAEVMNRLYVNIKVDREERPDLDKIYQAAHHLLNQRGGGWPLTVILTPDEHIPFFAGTYFPKTAAHGMPPFTEILQQVESFYRQHRDDIEKQNQSILDALNHEASNHTDNQQTLDATPIDVCRQQLASSFDHQYGGFGEAPKFPHPTNLEFLLRHYVASASAGNADANSLKMLRYSLHAMASGGIYDQLGGGFYRYAVDEKWAIPHFEKMLYDNGPLLSIYAQTWLALDKKDAPFRRIAVETAEWVMREMQSPEGGYYSTLDADSEGDEGKFYIWTPGETKQLLTKQEYAVIERLYGLNQPANFEGHWHFTVQDNHENIIKNLDLDTQSFTQLLTRAKQKLFNAREQRIHPGRDEKILTSWNGLMIKGMAIAGRILERPDFIESAQRAIDFIRQTLQKDARLLATCKDGRAHLNAYLDDYVFLIDGLLELLQARWRSTDLEFALQLADQILIHFYDHQQGGFYFTADDHEKLIQRPKPLMDEAIPAGNGIASLVMGKLGHLMGDTRYLDAARQTLQYAWPGINSLPYAHAALIFALQEQLQPPQTIVIRGNKNELTDWQQLCNQSFLPTRMSFAIPDSETNLPGLLNERKYQDRATAYVCEGSHCLPPLQSVAAFKTFLTTL